MISTSFIVCIIHMHHYTRMRNQICSMWPHMTLGYITDCMWPLLCPERPHKNIQPPPMCSMDCKSGMMCTSWMVCGCCLQWWLRKQIRGYMLKWLAQIIIGVKLAEAADRKATQMSWHKRKQKSHKQKYWVRYKVVHCNLNSKRNKQITRLRQSSCCFIQWNKQTLKGTYKSH